MCRPGIKRKRKVIDMCMHWFDPSQWHGRLARSPFAHLVRTITQLIDPQFSLLRERRVIEQVGQSKEGRSLHYVGPLPSPTPHA